tara:strand:+ start:319 stop:465 length:147 start_codon:yes stop_codon:yes gene_type:complete
MNKIIIEKYKIKVMIFFMKNKLYYLAILISPLLLSGCSNLGAAWNVGW